MLDSTAARADAEGKGISLDAGHAFRKQVLNTILVGLPLAGTIVACYWFLTHSISMIEISCFLLFYAATGIGVGVGFHRCFTHQSFRPIWPLKTLLLLAGSMSFQGSVIRWVADHRRHHRFTDRSWDTHSPYAYLTQPIQNRIAGMLHAHVGWMFDQTTTSFEVYAPDLLKDRTALWFHNFYLPITVSSLAFPFLYGLCFGSLDQAIGCLLLGGCVRTTAFHHVTWAVNSIGHTFGGREASERDSSRNNFPLAMLTFGDGWHNNHHAAPRSAYNHRKWYELDLNGILIWIFGQTGLADQIVVLNQIPEHRHYDDAIPEMDFDCRSKEEAVAASSATSQRIS